MVFSVMPIAGMITAQATEIWQQPRGTIITYGSYPQTRVTDSLTITSLVAWSSSVMWKSYGYYTGSGSWSDGQMKPSDYMKYKDFEGLDGNKYRAVTFTQYRPYCTGYTSSAGNSCQDENGYTPNNVYYFKYEPLRWRILDPSEGLVMCESIIDSQAYNNYILYANGEYYGDSAKTYYASNWAKSSLRSWLNDDFYNTAFSSSEKNAIKTSYLENKSTYSSVYDAPSTYDKVFLLSYWDAINSNYGFSSSYSSDDTARRAQGTDYAKCQGLGVSTSSSYYGNSFWRLRSPFSSCRTGNVDDLGSVRSYYYYTYYTYNGVRPALKFNPKSSIPGVTGVSIGDVSLNYKATTTITPKITADEGASYTVTYTSSNPSVATVDNNGKVTSVKQSGLNRGSTVITCTVTDSYGNTVSDTCTVTVNFTWWQWIIKIVLFGWIWY